MEIELGARTASILGALLAGFAVVMLRRDWTRLCGRQQAKSVAGYVRYLLHADVIGNLIMLAVGLLIIVGAPRVGH